MISVAPAVVTAVPQSVQTQQIRLVQPDWILRLMPSYDVVWWGYTLLVSQRTWVIETP